MKLSKIPLELGIGLITLDGNKVNRVINGNNLKIGTKRLVTFKLGNQECVYCGLKATHFEINDFTNKKGVVQNQAHINLWADDILMTNDHIGCESKSDAYLKWVDELLDRTDVKEYLGEVNVDMTEQSWRKCVLTNVFLSTEISVSKTTKTTKTTKAVAWFDKNINLQKPR